MKNIDDFESMDQLVEQLWDHIEVCGWKSVRREITKKIYLKALDQASWCTAQAARNLKVGRTMVHMARNSLNLHPTKTERTHGNG
jgi:transcriptional regulator with GAF, ATPase, and Fis domain